MCSIEKKSRIPTASPSAQLLLGLWTLKQSKASRMQGFGPTLSFVALVLMIENCSSGDRCAVGTLAAHYKHVISDLLTQSINQTNYIVQQKINATLHRNRTRNNKVKSRIRNKALNPPQVMALVCDILWKTTKLKNVSELARGAQDSLLQLRRNTASVMKPMVRIGKGNEMRNCLRRQLDQWVIMERCGERQSLVSG
ncbi:uncharacterized protein LOC103181939 isoform X2 [Callorhinchus milii]|uniref:uncharacterized protein LOC103181939 isoform X2 n=1 Tax=Callorhinchus milii TaxID=7868 RepID=UPI000457475A|nr:uncharacterized protein LOC103181939 isoform X2 [Callorhinchus milii]|eukprot:gi/632961741/ref/XP_007896929.1/ PREDICTED: uncharacterized protein LOC103181939 isoform X2 [Callorhinchus milii]